MENKRNITFRVKKNGVMLNAKFKVFVDGEMVGEVNFKKELTLPFTEGTHKVYFKVNLVTTNELEVDISNENKIVEWIYGGGEPHVISSNSYVASQGTGTVKVILKGAGLAEKPKVLIDGKEMDRVSNSKPAILKLENRKI